MLNLFLAFPVCLKAIYLNPFSWKDLSENLAIKKLDHSDVRWSPNSSWDNTTWLPISKSLFLCSINSPEVFKIQETCSAIPRSSHFSAFQTHAKCLLLPRFLWSAFLVKSLNIKLSQWSVQLRIMHLVIVPSFSEKDAKMIKYFRSACSECWSTWKFSVIFLGWWLVLKGLL